MPDKTYCYPNSDVLINKLNIRNQADLFEAEKELTYIRLKELQDHPIKGKFDFKHLKDKGYYISKARLSAMNTPCEKITRNTIYKMLEEN